MTPEAFLGVATASLAGSVHCAAMCGGFVAAYASDETARPGSRALGHVLYNGGRLVTYVMLGLLAGSLGRALDLAGHAAGVAQAAAIVTGLLLVMLGAFGLSSRSTGLRLKRGPSRPLASRVSALLVAFRNRPPALRAGLLGLVSTLLPCGWLYAFAALAGATGSAVDGALLMTAFWFGSLPVLLGLGISLRGFLGALWARAPRFRSLLVMGVGAVTLLSRLQLPAFAQSPAGSCHGRQLTPAAAAAGTLPGAGKAH